MSDRLLSRAVSILSTYYVLKRYGEAVRWLREGTSRLPNAQNARLWPAAAYAQLAQLEEARAQAAEVLRINQALTIERWKCLAVHNDLRNTEHRIDGLLRAGLPER